MSRLVRWPRLGARIVFAFEPIFRLWERRVRSPRTDAEHDFYVIEASDWVNVVPITTDGRLVCVRQYRHGVDRFSLEVPGGIMDEGETPEAAALRELEEETGYHAARTVYLGAVEVNPAMFTNRCHTVLALGVEPLGVTAFDAGEDIEVEVIPLADVPARVQNGDIGHALVVSALYLYEAWKRQHDASAT